jgi:hypothetical protein
VDNAVQLSAPFRNTTWDMLVEPRRFSELQYADVVAAGRQMRRWWRRLTSRSTHGSQNGYASDSGRVIHSPATFEQEAMTLRIAVIAFVSAAWTQRFPVSGAGLID